MASSVSGVVDSAKQAAGQAATQAKEAAGNALGQAKDQVATHADQQRESVAAGIQSVAHAFQSMGDDLKKQEGGPVAEYAAELGQAMGSQVEKLATYLKERDVRHLVTDAEDFARRSPAVFLGAAFVLGLAASRFLKSSRPAPAFIANMPDPIELCRQLRSRPQPRRQARSRPAPHPRRPSGPPKLLSAAAPPALSFVYLEPNQCLKSRTDPSVNYSAS